MNLQETLEAMLEERRRLVGKLTPAEQSRLLHEELGNLVEGAGVWGFGEQPSIPERDALLRRLAGACLYLLHPEDERTGGELVVAGLDHNGEPAGLPSPAPAGQRVRVLDPDRVMVADGKGGWQTISDGTQVPFEDEREVPFTVHRRKGGGLRRKPRPDRKP